MKKIILVLALAVSLSACGVNNEVKEHDEVNGITAENLEQTPAKNKKKLTKTDLEGELKPVSAVDKNGEEISLQLIWGTGIQYGGSLTIFEDGSYTEYIGIIGETDPLEGTVDILDDQIVLTSKTDVKKYVIVIEENVIELNYGEYIVRFERNL